MKRVEEREGEAIECRSEWRVEGTVLRGGEDTHRGYQRIYINIYEEGELCDQGIGALVEGRKTTERLND